MAHGGGIEGFMHGLVFVGWSWQSQGQAGEAE